MAEKMPQKKKVLKSRHIKGNRNGSSFLLKNKKLSSKITVKNPKGLPFRIFFAEKKFENPVTQRENATVIYFY